MSPTRFESESLPDPCLNCGATQLSCSGCGARRSFIEGAKWALETASIASSVQPVSAPPEPPRPDLLPGQCPTCGVVTIKDTALYEKLVAAPEGLDVERLADVFFKTSVLGTMMRPAARHLAERIAGEYARSFLNDARLSESGSPPIEQDAHDGFWGESGSPTPPDTYTAACGCISDSNQLLISCADPSHSPTPPGEER